MRIGWGEHAGSCGEEGRSEHHGSVLVLLVLVLLRMMDIVVMGLWGAVGVIYWGRRGDDGMVLWTMMHRIVWRGHVNVKEG
jgi:hypothetical protein